MLMGAQCVQLAALQVTKGEWFGGAVGTAALGWRVWTATDREGCLVAHEELFDLTKGLSEMPGRC